MPRLSKDDQLKFYHEQLDIDWDGCNIKDMPYVRRTPPGSNSKRDIDQMLQELGRRMSKNGRLDEYRDRQEFTKPSKKRREARRQQEYMLKNNPQDLTY
jgi:ribosomal protein S21